MEFIRFEHQHISDDRLRRPAIGQRTSCTARLWRSCTPTFWAEVWVTWLELRNFILGFMYFLMNLGVHPQFFFNCCFPTPLSILWILPLLFSNTPVRFMELVKVLPRGLMFDGLRIDYLFSIFHSIKILITFFQLRIPQHEVSSRTVSTLGWHRLSSSSIQSLVEKVWSIRRSKRQKLVTCSDDSWK